MVPVPDEFFLDGVTASCKRFLDPFLELIDFMKDERLQLDLHREEKAPRLP